MKTMLATPEGSGEETSQHPYFDRECPLGLTYDELQERIGPDHWAAFEGFMYGQTGIICDGGRYDSPTGEYVETECFDSPHGPVVYERDYERFARNNLMANLVHPECYEDPRLSWGGDAEWWDEIYRLKDDINEALNRGD